MEIPGKPNKALSILFVALITLSLLLVFAGAGFFFYSKSIPVDTLENETLKDEFKADIKERMFREAEGDCKQLEYRYKSFRTLRRRHMATIFFLNGDR